jgi:hypothetical protein
MADNAWIGGVVGALDREKLNPNPTGMSASAMDSPRTVHPSTPPASPLQAALIFALTSLLFFACLYVALPFLRRMNASWFVCFNLVLALPMLSLVGCALFAYMQEGHAIRWPVLRDRFRLGRMGLSSWMWTVGPAVFMFGGRYAQVVALFVAFVAVSADRELGRRRKCEIAVLVAIFNGTTCLLWMTRLFFITIPFHPFPQELQQFLSPYGPKTRISRVSVIRR